MQAWYLGTESGNAIASVLMGDVNPSGKLPFTFPVALEDVGAHKLGEYPGVPRNDGSGIVDEKYNEGIFVGYRWAEKNKIAPLFPFGHGLSYTTFAYGTPVASSKTMTADGNIQVSLTVKNTGTVAGKEVVQLYIGDEKSSVPRPVKELKGFRKVELLPGEEKEVVFTITDDDLKFFDAAAHAWKAEPGRFKAYVAASATDVRATLTFEYK